MRWLICLVPLLVLSTPARAAWREATSTNFVVYSDGSAEELVEFTQRVERFDQVLRIMTGVKEAPPPLKVRIYLVDSDDVVREMHLHHQPYVAGFYGARISGGLAVVNRKRARNAYAMDGEIVLYHEYSHHFMAQYSHVAYPIWYQEGFAEYFASTTFRKGGGVFEVGKTEMPRVPALILGKWLTTQQLMTSTLDTLTVEQTDLFYAQGWLLTHYLFNSPQRHEQFTQYLSLRGQGVSHDDAMQKAFNLTDSQLDAELHSYFAKGKLMYKRLTTPSLAEEPKVSVRPLTQPEADCLLLAARVEIGFPEVDKQKVLEQVRTKAQHLAGNEYAQVMLGAAEAQYGDATRAHEILQTQLTATPNNRRALLTLAMLELQTDQPDHTARLAADHRARKLAAKANSIDAYDPEALYLFYLSFANEEHGPNQNAIDALAEAYHILPQYEPLVYAQARQDVHDGKPEQAVAELRPIAYSPHNEKHARKLQAWIQEIEAKKSPVLADSIPGDESAEEAK